MKKTRKNIRLKNYDYSSNGLYFVTICTNFRRPFLDDKKIKEIVVDELARLKTRFKRVEVDYFAVVPNHIHLVLYFEDSKYSLPQVIQAFKSLTTLRAKQALPLQVKTQLWQRNYYEHVIRTDKVLNKIREYIQNNPLVERLKVEELY